MNNFNMSKLYLSKDGKYRDLNGNIVGATKTGLTKNAQQYLAKKYGNSYANRVMANMAAGHIYQNGNWRMFDKLSGFNKTASYKDAVARNTSGTKKVNGRYMFQDPITKKWTYFNQDAANAALKKSKIKNSPSKNSWDMFTGMWGNLGNDISDDWSNVKGFWSNFAKGNYRKAGSNLLGQAGSTGRLINHALEGTVGAVTNAVLPKEWTEGIAKYGLVLDPAKDLESVFSGYAPWDPRNKGLANDNHWSWLGTLEDRRNITDAANGAVSVFGTKGIGGTAKGMVRGALKTGSLVKKAKAVAPSIRDVGTLKTIQKAKNTILDSKDLLYVPFIGQAREAVKAANNLGKSFKSGISAGLRGKSFASSVGNTMMAAMPDLWLWHKGLGTGKALSVGMDPSEYQSLNWILPEGMSTDQALGMATFAVKHPVVTYNSVAGNDISKYSNDEDVVKDYSKYIEQAPES